MKFNPDEYVAVIPKKGVGALVDVFLKSTDTSNLPKDNYDIMPLSESIDFIKNLNEPRGYVTCRDDVKEYLKENGMDV